MAKRRIGDQNEKLTRPCSLQSWCDIHTLPSQRRVSLFFLTCTLMGFLMVYLIR
jgi:hypothetical protein